MMTQHYDDQLQWLLDATSKVVKASQENQSAAAKAIRSLEETQRRIETRLGNVSRDVTGAIEKSAETTASETARLLRAKLAAADQAAAAAAERYQEVARWIGWKMTAAAVLVLVVALAAGRLIAQYTLPSQADIDGRRAVAEQLDARIAGLRQQVADLERQGGGLQLETCKDADGHRRLCFRTNEAEGTGAYQTPGQTYRIPWGY